jgi:hypothetical protein
MRAAVRAESKATSHMKPALTSTRSGLLQRKCACDGTYRRMGECDSCRNTPAPGTLRSNSNLSFLLNSQTSEISLVNKTPPARGEQLGAGISAAMESAFRADFSNVRVHRDGLADAHHARAVTLGEEVHLSASEPDLTSARGRGLMGHELAHVLQQRKTGGATQPLSVLELEADRAATAAAAGHHFSVRGRLEESEQRIQKKPKLAPAPASGNILYVGMNNADPEVEALQKRYKPGGPVNLTSIKATAEETATDIGTGSKFDLTISTGMEALATALTPDRAKQTSLKSIFNSQMGGDRDDLAHVAKVYADTEVDGKDRMTRVVLSGHSGGLGVFGSSGEVYFTALVELGNIFPAAANQTKHLIVAGCHTGDEGTILSYYVKAFPSLLTVWAWWDVCPTGSGAAAAISKWATLTEHGETKLPKQDGGIATWSGGVYEGNPSAKAPVSSVLDSIRADNARFQEYFDGTRADSGPHGGWLEAYYGRLFSAARRPDITGADHDEVEQKRQRALLLRFWKNVARNFWAENGSTIVKGYGATPVPDYGNLSRKATLKAIADFPSVAKGSAAEQTAASSLLHKLESLDSKKVPDSMVAD